MVIVTFRKRPCFMYNFCVVHGFVKVVSIDGIYHFSQIAYDIRFCSIFKRFFPVVIFFISLFGGLLKSLGDIHLERTQHFREN